MSEVVAVVGCGSSKRDEDSRVEDLYTSNYFQLKREYAEIFADRWVVISAEHDLIASWRRVEPYDTTIDDRDWDVFVDTVAGSLRSPFIGLEYADEILVLAGQQYAEAFRAALDCDRERSSLFDPVADQTEVTYLFDEIGASGIGEQMAWIREAIDQELRRPDDGSSDQQASLKRYKDRCPVSGGSES